MILAQAISSKREAGHDDACNQTGPDFTAPAVMPDGSLKDDFRLSDYRDKYAVLFFYPLDFTFVCPTEIIAHDRRVEKLQALDVQVIGVSIDSQFTHHAWRETPIEQVGIGAVRFPLIADIDHAIVKAYGVELIDREGVIQHQVVNSLPLGRNVDEMVRLVEALQFTEQHGEVCPAGWRQGDQGMWPHTWRRMGQE